MYVGKFKIFIIFFKMIFNFGLKFKTALKKYVDLPVNFLVFC